MKKITLEIATDIKAWFGTPEAKEAISTIEKSQDSVTGTFEVVISTENLDRYNEVIKLDGWDLTHYRNNPVVLWGHDHKQLIGMATSVEAVDGKLVAKGRFAPNALGQETRQLYDMGFLKATSVGFMPKNQEGNIITEAELLEFSFVSVPANPYALALAMENNLNMNELVTKGFMDIKQGEPVESPAPEKTEEETEKEKEIEVTEAEKTFSVKAITPIIEQMKGVITAFEALNEPEREEASVAETEDEKELKKFTENRKLLQDVATLVGEVLAGTRKAIEAKKQSGN